MDKRELLFEAIRRGDEPRPGLWQRIADKLSGTDKPITIEQTPAPHELLKQAQATKPDEPAPQIDRAGTREPDKKGKGKGKGKIHVNVFTVTVAGAILGIVFVCGYLVGRQNRATGIEQRSVDQMEQIRNQQPNPDVLAVHASGRTEAGTAGPDVPTGVRTEDPQLGEKITRKDDLNYLIIHSFGRKAAARRAQRFLAEGGVATTIERRGPYYKLISVLGVDYKREKVKRAAFENKVRALGGRYKTMPGSEGIDFGTCQYYRWPLD